jgi:hypothetical protein
MFSERNAQFSYATRKKHLLTVLLPYLSDIHPFDYEGGLHFSSTALIKMHLFVLTRYKILFC